MKFLDNAGLNKIISLFKSATKQDNVFKYITNYSTGDMTSKTAWVSKKGHSIYINGSFNVKRENEDYARILSSDSVFKLGEYELDSGDKTHNITLKNGTSNIYNGFFVQSGITTKNYLIIASGHSYLGKIDPNTCKTTITKKKININDKIVLKTNEDNNGNLGTIHIGTSKIEHNYIDYLNIINDNRINIKSTEVFISHHNDYKQYNIWIGNSFQATLGNANVTRLYVPYIKNNYIEHRSVFTADSTRTIIAYDDGHGNIKYNENTKYEFYINPKVSLNERDISMHSASLTLYNIIPSSNIANTMTTEEKDKWYNMGGVNLMDELITLNRKYNELQTAYDDLVDKLNSLE